MATRETSSTSWFGRLGQSIKGVVIGIILFIIGFPVLWINEKRSAETIAGLNQLLKEVVTVDADNPGSEYEGLPVHTTGLATTDEILADAEFGITANAIKLTRDVQMLQWQEKKVTETRKKLGGGEETVTTYDYEKIWANRWIDSNRFKEEGYINPRFPFEESTLVAKNVTLGNFKLPPFLINQMNRSETITLNDETFQNLPEAKRSQFAVVGNSYYRGDHSSPQIGDFQVTFRLVEPGVVSVIANQKGKTFERYLAKNGKSFGLLAMGELGKEGVVQIEQEKNKLFTWILRFVGWLVMFIGLATILRPLSVLADVVPLIGNVVGAGTGFIAGILTAAISLMVIAIAWVVYRPLLSIPLGIVALILIFFAFTRLRKAKAKASQ